MRAMPEIMNRVKAVKHFRSLSKKIATQKIADTAYLFGELRQPRSDYVAIPLHSSEHRKYVPMGFFTKDHILNYSCSAVPHASLYHFGVLHLGHAHGLDAPDLRPIEKRLQLLE